MISGKKLIIIITLKWKFDCIKSIFARSLCIATLWIWGISHIRIAKCLPEHTTQRRVKRSVECPANERSKQFLMENTNAVISLSLGITRSVVMAALNELPIYTNLCLIQYHKYKTLVLYLVKTWSLSVLRMFKKVKT